MRGVMSFVEIRFPEDISYGSSGGPLFSTDIVESHNGFEQRNSNWAQARARYNVAHGVKTQAQLDILIAFFRARKGKAYGFRFKDWSDYQAVGSIIGSGDGNITDFQLIKNYTSGTIAESRIIHKPVIGSYTLYKDGEVQTETTDYTIDTSTGRVSFTNAPENNAIISADFEFDVPVRFDTDQVAIKLDTYGVQTMHDIAIIELRIGS